MKMITLAGTVGKDAILRRTQGGDPVLGFSLAIDDGYGENKSTMWFDMAIWGKRGEALQSHIKKGMKLTAVGDFGLREHEGKYYPMCRVSEVSLQGGGEQRQTMTARNGETYGRADVRAHVKSSPQSFREDLDDSLPF